MSATSVVIPAKAGIQTVHLIGSVGVRFGLTASGLGPRLRGDDKGREQR
jgi:hypothetical protein